MVKGDGYCRMITKRTSSLLDMAAYFYRGTVLHCFGSIVLPLADHGEFFYIVLINLVFVIVT